MEKGLLYPGSTVIESTSGNMGIGLARVCHYWGLRLILVTDPHINPLARKITEAFGAKIVKVDKHDGKGGYLNTRLAKVQELLQEIPDSFWPDQYHNLDNPTAHEDTFLEILEALGHDPDYFFISTSTCGTLRGFADAIRKHGSNAKVVAVDTIGSVIFGGKPRPRMIPGMGASRPSSFLRPEDNQDVELLSEKECIAGCHLLLDEESILAGGSSGAVIKAIQKRLPLLAHRSVVAILPDNGERYLDSVYSKTWVDEHMEKPKERADV